VRVWVNLAGERQGPLTWAMAAARRSFPQADGKHFLACCCLKCTCVLVAVGTSYKRHLHRHCCLSSTGYRANSFGVLQGCWRQHGVGVLLSEEDPFCLIISWLTYQLYKLTCKAAGHSMGFMAWQLLYSLRLRS
jgi:hypothetical protein